MSRFLPDDRLADRAAQEAFKGGKSSIDGPVFSLKRLINWGVKVKCLLLGCHIFPQLFTLMGFTLPLVDTEGESKKCINSICMKKRRWESFYLFIISWKSLHLKDNVDRTGGGEHLAHGKWSLMSAQNGVVAGHSALLSKALAHRAWCFFSGEVDYLNYLVLSFS